jgi:hypothetical protein
MSWFAVGGAVVSIGTSIYANSQNKKKAPDQAPAINAQTEQDKAVQGNLANQADIEKLTASTNKFNQTQANSLMEQAMPGYKNLASSLTSRAQGLANDPYAVPQDVQDNLQRLAAEKGVNTGRTGQAGQFSLLRDLGVNQLQYGQANLQTASGLTSLLSSIAPKVNPMSPMSMYITPGQQIQTAENNQAMTQGGMNANAAAANANAQSNANMWGQIGGAASGLLGSFNTPAASMGQTPAPASSFNMPGTDSPEVQSGGFLNKNGP